MNNKTLSLKHHDKFKKKLKTGTAIYTNEHIKIDKKCRFGLNEFVLMSA